MAYFDREILAPSERPRRTRAPVAGSAGPIILDFQVDRVHRDRDFGRVEARIGLLLKEPHRPIRLIHVLTNVPTRGAASLRDRLLADAAALVRARGSAPDAGPHAA